MKNFWKHKLLAGFLAIALAISMVPASLTAMAAGEGEAAILYTNDVHGAINNYGAIAAYGAQLEAEGYKTFTVDAGDAVQGEVVTSLTDGAAAVDVMNAAGYDYAVPGNHEFDYGMDVFKELSGQVDAEVMPAYQFLSANFVDLATNAPVFKAYDIQDIGGGRKVAFVGISTPETYTKSTPEYFQDKNGNYIYSFCEGSQEDPSPFYAKIQEAVDSARAEGATIVIAVGHLGIDAGSAPYRSYDAIANTNGIDAFIDGHSHSVIPSETVNNKDGAPVLLTSTGTKLANIGKMTIAADGAITSGLVNPADVNVNASPESQAAYNAAKTVIDKYNELAAFTYEVLGVTETGLYINDPATGKRLIRSQETNLGDYVADAYRTVTGAQIAFANGGGIRKDVEAGEVTRKNFMDVNAFGNQMCVLKVTGQQLLDALEWSAHAPLNDEGTGLTENGGFVQTSGITFDINLHVKESPCTVDDKGVYTGIDATKPRRVQNVKVNGEAIDPSGTYTLAGSAYTLQQGGDGYSMFKGAEVVKADCGKDQELLMAYMTDHLKGVIPASLYGNVAGQGRIRNIPANSEEAHRYVETGRVEPTTDKEGSVTYTCTLCGETKTQALEKLPAPSQTSPQTPPKTSPKTSDVGNVEVYLILAAALGLAAMAAWKQKERKHSA